MPNISIAQANVALPPSQISVGGVRSVTFATTWDVYFPTGMTFFLSDHVLLMIATIKLYGESEVC